MQLLSKAHYLVFVTGDTIKKMTKKLGHCEGVWVGYDDKGYLVGHVPYQQNEDIRDAIIILADAKMERFKHAPTG